MRHSQGTRRILATAAAAEAVVGSALVLSPSLVTSPLLGAEALGIALIAGRVAGIALVALAFACWPRADAPGDSRSYGGLVSYNGLAALLFAYVGLSDGPHGILLWPAAAVHSVIALLLAFCWASDRSRAP
jgi:hypothetical protein